MIKYLYLIILILFGGGLVLVSHVQALTVSPPRIEVFSNAGEVFKGEFLLYNEQLETKTFYSSFENFEALGEEGAPSFTSATEGLATWIETTPQITLGPGEQLKIPYQITIPPDTEDGGYFAAIFWGSSPPQIEGAGQVAVGAKIGILVLLRVGESIEEGGGLLEFSTVGKKRFFSSLPISFNYRFQNSGGDRVKPDGEIKVKNSLGLTSVTLSANPTEGNVLPGSARKFSVTWGLKDTKDKEDKTDSDKEGFFQTVKTQWTNFHLGIYKAKLDLSYGRKDIVTVKDSYFFFIFPWQLLSLLVVVIVFIGFIIKKGLKHYNRKIINKAKELKK